MGAQLVGRGVSPGIAIGPVAHMGVPVRELPEARLTGDPAVERVRVERALEDVAADLERRRDRAEGSAREILDAQVMMARDPALLDAARALTDGGKPAPHAVDEAIRSFQSQLAALGGYMAERAADLDDLRNRALARLLHLPMPGVPERDEPFVLVAADLAPADTVDLNRDRVLALVTEHGGPTSHTAIIAKAMGLPAIVSCPGALDLDDGVTVIVDGMAGTVTVAPSEKEVAAARDLQAHREALLATGAGPGRTADGHPVQLLLNVGEPDPAAGELDAEGIGLLRTELLYLDRSSEPDVDEQAAIYRKLFAAFAGRKVVVRTLDVGADKPLPFVDPGPGDNPALGLRGDRLRQLNPGLIERQLQALAMAADGSPADVWVMAPMIATVAEARTFVEQAHAAGLPTAGVMVEVPALALDADRLMDVVDFVSIGTNDLSQYTFAADRLVGELGELLDPWQPPLLQLVARVARAGLAAGVPVGVCGEAASDPALAIVLAGLGVSSLSMAAPAVPEVRIALAALTLADCEARAARALGAPDPEAARAAAI